MKRFLMNVLVLTVLFGTIFGSIKWYQNDAQLRTGIRQTLHEMYEELGEAIFG